MTPSQIAKRLMVLIDNQFNAEPQWDQELLWVEGPVITLVTSTDTFKITVKQVEERSA